MTDHHRHDYEGRRRRGRDEPAGGDAGYDGYGEYAGYDDGREDRYDAAAHGYDDGYDDGYEDEVEGSVADGGDGDGTRRGWWRIGRWFVLAAAILLIVPVVAFGIAYMATEVPSPNALAAKEPRVAEIFIQETALDAAGNPTYDANGNRVGRPVKFAEIVPPAGKRTPVELATVPKHVREAVIAAEDRDFYRNPGFDISALGRAVVGQLTGNSSAGGGSTITQQYVKNALVGDERSFTRKAKELVIATKMANEWSKDDILEAYLNTIYFGRGAFGIEQAAKAYFGKSIADVDVAEGALLAAVIQSPGMLDPETNRTGAEGRWNYVLDGMVTTGALPAADRTAAAFPEGSLVRLQDRAQQQALQGPDGIIEQRIKDELNRLVAEGRLRDEDISTRGLRIYTTIDRQMQDATVEAARSTLKGQPENLRTGVASIDPRTGAIKAYYGGEDGQGWDRANAPLMTGSAFKVFGLAAALDQGIPLNRTYSSAPYVLGGTTINNAGGMTCGTCTIATALRMSLNTSFYRLMMDLEKGPASVAEMAHRLGVAESIPGVAKTLADENGDVGYGIILGGYQSRVLDMASGYATLAASGVYRAPHFIEKIEDQDGFVLVDNSGAQGDRRVDAAVADNISAAMEPIAAYSNGHALAGGRVSASKTGTVQLGNTGQNRDAWMVGYTPQLSTAVWVGTDDGEAIVNSWGGPIYGAGLPSDIWKKTMDGALAGAPYQQFPTPDAIGGQAGIPAEPTPTSTESSPETTVVTTQPHITLPDGSTIPLGPPIPMTVETTPTSEPQSPPVEPGEGLPDPPGAAPGGAPNGRFQPQPVPPARAVP